MAEGCRLAGARGAEIQLSGLEDRLIAASPCWRGRRHRGGWDAREQEGVESLRDQSG
jgi:hypothetical protein